MTRQRHWIDNKTMLSMKPFDQGRNRSPESPLPEDFIDMALERVQIPQNVVDRVVSASCPSNKARSQTNSVAETQVR